MAAHRILPGVKKLLHRCLGFCGLARRSGRGDGAFVGSEHYWESRYSSGGNSGAGSYGRLAQFKAETVNEFVQKNAIHTVIEFGCGDGHQLLLANYPAYIGIDVSPTVISRCRQQFRSDPSKQFYTDDEFRQASHRYRVERFDLALSLDVIYHLVEDQVFAAYMTDLFQWARRYVIVYSTDCEARDCAPHVRHRCFTSWVASHCDAWQLVERIPNKYYGPGDGENGTSPAEFFVFQRVPTGA
jgi:hypothetical protein